MADPLSITASIIAVVGAAEGVGKTINKIRNFREAPYELFSLINEISDFRIVLGDIEGNLIQNTSYIQLQAEQSEHMSALLDRAKEQLLQLDELVQYQLVRPDSTSQQVKVSRQTWARATNTVKTYRKSIRNTRLNIIAYMTVINAFVSSILKHIETETLIQLTDLTNPVLALWSMRFIDSQRVLKQTNYVLETRGPSSG